MNTKTRLFLLGSLICFSSLAQVDSVYMGRPTGGQSPKAKSPRSDEWKNTMTWGGNFQAWLGNPTFILLSPTIGFTPYKNINVGLGVIYNYTSYQSAYGNYQQSIWGGHSYLRYTFAESYFVLLQYDKLYQPNLLSFDPRDKIWVNYPMVGIGFMQKMGEKAALTTSIMYYLYPSPLSIYPSRVIIQFGITGGF